MTAPTIDAAAQAVMTVVHRLLREEITLADAADTLRALGLSPDPADLAEAKHQLFARDFHVGEAQRREALALNFDLRLRLLCDRLARPAEGTR